MSFKSVPSARADVGSVWFTGDNPWFTDSIREDLKERSPLPAEGTHIEIHESLRWTNEQKQQWQRYEPRRVVTILEVDTI